MKLEQFPILLGVIVGLFGLLVAYDAFSPMSIRPFRERRRRARAAMSRQGELLVAIGVVAVAVALVNRDTGRFGTVAVIGGAVFLLAGGLMNRQYLREMLLFRGPARRADEEEKAENPNERPVERDRIR